MCVFRNMIVRSGVFVKSLMNIRTNIKWQLLLPFYVATSNIILEPTQARKGAQH